MHEPGVKLKERRDGASQTDLGRRRETRYEQRLPFCQIFSLRLQRVPKHCTHRPPQQRGHTEASLEVFPHLQVMMIVFSPSQEGLSAMTLAWVVTSCGDS